jgi:hypothetical protein
VAENDLTVTALPVREITRWDNGRVKPQTVAPKRLTRTELVVRDRDDYPDDAERPLTRADCQAAARPCPWVSCVHHLYLDVNPVSGAIKLNFPHLEPHEMAETCSLDVADRGGITLEEVGAILNLTRERIRQQQEKALASIKNQSGIELGLPPDHE